MGQKKVNNKDISRISMVELASWVLNEQKKEMKFLDLYEKISELKKLSEQDKERQLSQFYTDLNMDGQFIALGSNVWGLKHWFPLSKTSEKALTEARRREEEDDEETEIEEDNFSI